MQPLQNFRLLALIVAGAFFMEQMDTTIIATALPTMAVSLHANALHMSMAMTSYLLGLVVFIPISGWVADRWGSRTIFSAAIAVFTLGSILCALSPNLPCLIAARLLQGLGGAMMVPVGRLTLLQSIDRSQYVEAMAWVLFPAMVGPVLGPPVGGLIVTYASWRWIFIANVPIGLLGFVLVSLFVPQIRGEARVPLDVRGVLLSGLAMSALTFGLGLSTQHGSLSDAAWPLGLFALALVAGLLYARHARRTPHPVLDFSLLRLPTFRIAVMSGTLTRIGYGALPFLLPLMLQVGFGFSPLESGLVTFAAAIGGLAMKPATVPILRWFGYRTILAANGGLCALSLALCALFRPGWPPLAMALILLIGGLARSLQYNSYGTIAYADVPKPRMSQATSFFATIQQLSATLGVSVAAWMLGLTLQLTHSLQPAPFDFSVVFVAIGVISAIAVPSALRLAHDAGAELSGHRPASAAAADPVESSRT